MRRKREKSRVDDGMKFVIEKINDENFIKGFGHYIKFNNQIIVPKYQDVVYSKTRTIDIPELVEMQRKYLLDNGFPDLRNATYFLVPISAVIALPAGYHANRVLLKDATEMDIDKILSVTLINGIQNHGKDDDADELYSGVCYGFIGCKTPEKIKSSEVLKTYEQCVDYLNDFITAYKLFRHDHTVNNVTIRTLPGRVEYYTEEDGKLSGKKIARFHDNDIADLWSKRLPFKDEMPDIKNLSEFLPSNRIAHYALRIAEESITNLCLGQFEDCILNSDRFAEIVLREILQQELNLSPDEMGNYRNLWSTDRPDSAVIQTLASKFNIKGDATLDKWYKKSRTARNDIVHKLDVNSVTPDVAYEAMKHNMLIVNLMVSKSTKDFQWYKLPPNTFSTLFMNGRPLNT